MINLEVEKQFNEYKLKQCKRFGRVSRILSFFIFGAFALAFYVAYTSPAIALFESLLAGVNLMLFFYNWRECADLKAELKDLLWERDQLRGVQLERDNNAIMRQLRIEVQYWRDLHNQTHTFHGPESKL